MVSSMISNSHSCTTSSYLPHLKMITITFLLPHRGGSECRPTTQAECSNGRFRAGIGAICWAPISWCWYPRMLLPFCPVALEEGSSNWSVQERSCDMTIHSQGCSSCLCATGLCEDSMGKHWGRRSRYPWDWWVSSLLQLSPARGSKNQPSFGGMGQQPKESSEP